MNAIAQRRRSRLYGVFVPQAAAAVSNPSALDIVEIRNFPVREPVSGSRYSLLRVKARSGLTGWGECASIAEDELKVLESGWQGKPAHTYAVISGATPAGG